jgi:hypothetical protein
MVQYLEFLYESLSYAELTNDSLMEDKGNKNFLIDLRELDKFGDKFFSTVDLLLADAIKSKDGSKKEEKKSEHQIICEFCKINKATIIPADPFKFCDACRSIMLSYAN